MQHPPEMAQQKDHSTSGRTLHVDFSWRKYSALISEKDDMQSTPVYTVNYKVWKPQFIFKSAQDGSTLGTGTIYPVSINADCSVHGQPVALKAQKRFKTEYMHLSQTFSDTDAAPVPMTWTAACGWKTWDFVCLDPLQNPVARFSANVWALHKVGVMEFLGDRAAGGRARDELVVTGLTLFYCMALRSSSIFSLFGAFVAHPGRDAKEAAAAGSGQPAVNGDKDRVAA